MPTERYSVPQQPCAKCHLPMHPDKQAGEVCAKCQAEADKQNDEKPKDEERG